MSDPIRPARSEEQRQAFFEELMREELSRQPINRLAIATFVFGLLGGLLAVILAPFAIAQMRAHQQRGMPLVVIGLAAFTIWAVVFAVRLASGTTLG